ncbi:TlpA family protein disulfide reductase [Vandammella animalimorsus]|uniref:TlpA family protein disulfide reductase n=1 Tax=Vandammella animalimorsus TaxID=2029117 RepID=A0A3M6RT71_9BURK|nr:TlpA family protein disulfide reductase [Vandammella animalimorsus]
MKSPAPSPVPAPLPRPSSAASAPAHDGHGAAPGLGRRQWLLWGGGALALAAAGAGGYWGWLRQRHSAAEAALWSIALPRLDGRQLALRDYQGRPLLLNFWATWCAPCVQELPLLNQWQRQRPDWAVVGVAVDTLPNVQRFAQRMALDFPIGIAGGGQGMALARALGGTGGLPLTVLADAQGQIRARKLGQIEPADLQHWQSLLA